MTEKTYKIKGMHCASCAGIIEKTLKKTEGVIEASVSYGAESAKISFDESKTNIENLSKKIIPLGYSFVFDDKSSNEKKENSELKEMRMKIMIAIPLAIISILFMAWEILSKYGFLPEMGEVVKSFFHHLMPVFATYILFVLGKPYLLGVYRFFKYGKANMDTLIGIGTGVAFLYSFIISAFGETLLKNYSNILHSYYDVTIVVITFIALGKYLETRSKAKTGDAIEKLLNLQAKMALVIQDGKEFEISINEVVHGDIIIVKPGSKIPVDGIVTEGNSYIDESMITGEPMPVDKKFGDSVSAGTINTNGSFMFRATKVGNETMLAQIIKMVEDAQGSKAPIQALADKISSIFVPIVLVIAFITFIAWISFGGPIGISYGLMSFVAVLVIACPCALGLATPTAIIVGVGKGAKEGILIKDATTLEKLYKVDTIIVDKTGTITKGKPTLVDVKNNSNFTVGEFISIIASLEKKSEHPIAHAILNYAEEKKIATEIVADFKNIEGKGLSGAIGGVEYFVGNIKLIQDLKINFDASVIEEYTAQGKTPVILATKNEVFGFVMVTDEIKIEVTFEKHLENKILKALFSNHVYEEVAYEIYQLQNKHQNIGMGMIGELQNPMSEKEFLYFVKEQMQADGIRHSAFLNKPIKKVAVLGGAGSFAIKSAIKAGADAFLTADLKYHQFYEAENQLLLVDIGHFESERYTKNYIVDFLRKKILNFAFILSEENTNPVKYL